MTLKATIRGPSRAEIIENAAAIAAKYYGTECIVVELSNESTEMLDEPMLTDPTNASVIAFVADYGASVLHRYSTPSFGFPKCDHCGVTKHG